LTGRDGLDFVPVFVIGVPRSGTTWVWRMLESHPAAGGLLETYMFDATWGLAALLKRLPEPGAETQVPEPGAETPVPAGLGRLFDREELIGEIREIGARWLRLGAPDARFVIEKSPWHLRQARLLAEVFPEARFVNVLRDGRDVTVSLISARRSWSDVGPSDAREVVEEVARLWRDAHILAGRAREAAGDRLLEVRYERLLADPAAGCRRLFGHCGMPADDALIETVVEGTAFNRIPEQERGEGMSARKGRSGEWRERFGLLDAFRFDRIAGTTLARTGYEDKPRWWLRRPLRSRL
jgi:hypothetical protein